MMPILLAAVVSCHHKPPQVEPPPRWRWANVGKCTTDAPATDLPLAARDSLGYPFGRFGRGDPWAARAIVSRRVPGGWGGLALRGKGEDYGIYLIDTTQRSAALAALAAAGIRSISPTTVAVQGRWTYAQIYDWFRYIHSHLRGVAVNSWTLDEQRNRIYYGVEDEAAALELDRRLTALKVPCFLVVREVVGLIRVAGAERRLRLYDGTPLPVRTRVGIHSELK